MSMSVSLQKSTTRTNIKHNNRTMSEKEKEQIDSFLNLDSTGITVDLDILIGVKSTS